MNTSTKNRLASPSISITIVWSGFREVVSVSAGGLDLEGGVEVAVSYGGDDTYARAKLTGAAFPRGSPGRKSPRSATGSPRSPGRWPPEARDRRTLGAVSRGRRDNRGTPFDPLPSEGTSCPGEKPLAVEGLQVVSEVTEADVGEYGSSSRRGRSSPRSWEL